MTNCKKIERGIQLDFYIRYFSCGLNSLLPTPEQANTRRFFPLWLGFVGEHQAL